MLTLLKQSGIKKYDFVKTNDLSKATHCNDGCEVHKLTASQKEQLKGQLTLNEEEALQLPVMNFDEDNNKPEMNSGEEEGLPLSQMQF